MTTNPQRWKIESGTDFVTGKSVWLTTPPRSVYRPNAPGKRSFPTYDQALAHVRASKERRPLVFESKTHIGQWFWLHPDGQSGWAKTRDEATANAHRTDLETEVA